MARARRESIGFRLLNCTSCSTVGTISVGHDIGVSDEGGVGNWHIGDVSYARGEYAKLVSVKLAEARRLIESEPRKPPEATEALTAIAEAERNTTPTTLMRAGRALGLLAEKGIENAPNLIAIARLFGVS